MNFDSALQGVGLNPELSNPRSADPDWDVGVSEN